MRVIHATHLREPSNANQPWERRLAVGKLFLRMRRQRLATGEFRTSMRTLKGAPGEIFLRIGRQRRAFGEGDFSRPNVGADGRNWRSVVEAPEHSPNADCTSSSVQATCRAALISTSTSAPARWACSLRCRRHALAPGRPWNRPSMWRVMAFNGTPSRKRSST
jgi:hypothetical protein